MLRQTLRPRKDARERIRSLEIDAILEARRLPLRLRGFNATRRWLWSCDDEVIRAARALFAHAAVVSPAALVAPTWRHEIGACALARAAYHHARFVRGVDAFAPRASSNGRAQVREWLAHLFVHAPVPSFAVETLLRPARTLSSWGFGATPPKLLPHVGQGGSFVDAGLPLVLDRRMARALASSTVRGPRLAVRRAQMDAAGVDPAMAAPAAAFLADDVFGDGDEEALIARFVRFLGRVRLEPAELHDVSRAVSYRRRVDAGYMFDDKTAGDVVREARRDCPPTQRIDRDVALGVFPPSGIRSGADVVEGFTLREIDSGIDLVDEGRRMRHCVEIYGSDVSRGDCAIFAMTPKNEENRGVTIEVALPKRVIVQVKGYKNRDPTAGERAALSAWAARAGLTVAHDILHPDDGDDEC